MAKQPDPDRMYLARETVSITLNGPYEFLTLHLGERRSGRDPVVQEHFEWFVDELDTSSDQLKREAQERHMADREAYNARRQAEKEEAEEAYTDTWRFRKRLNETAPPPPGEDTL